ncbi:helix-turn-helix domain-containing protein [Thermobifida fusca]|nr:helix-turn-helix domain-containing protein [Thermobifida fusca]
MNRGQHHQPPRILLTVPEAARVLAISQSKLYELLASGAVRSLRIGGSRRIPVSALDDYVSGLLDQEEAA